MTAPAKLLLKVALCLTVAAALSTVAIAQTQPAAGAATPRIGAIKAINGSQITLTPDAGSDVNVTVQDTTRFLRIAPGEKNLKNATPIQMQDLQAGDRIMVGGKTAPDGSLAAATIVVMKRFDVEARKQQELQDWQKRGMDGLATAVDPSAGTVTISVGGLGAKKNVVIHTSGSTVIRRYAADSVRFDDAKAGSLRDMHAGDQVRARGDRSAEGGDLTAEEIVFGSFRNIAGTVNSLDASSSTLDVHDLLSKKNITVKVSPDSQLRNLPPEMAQRIAARLKAAAMGGVPGAPVASPEGNGQNARPAGAPGGTGGGGSGRSGGGADLQRMLSMVPAASLADLHKGDAVVILSTEGSEGQGTVVTLLTGVEPILQAAPNSSGASILTPWSLSAPSGDAGGP